MRTISCDSLFFFFNDTATTEIYTLSLHDALPIFAGESTYKPQPIAQGKPGCFRLHLWSYPRASTHLLGAHGCDRHPRSEERRVGKECRARWWPDHERKHTGVLLVTDLRVPLRVRM